MGLFGTNGVRGKLDALPPALAFDLSAAFSAWSEGKKIVLARDMRLTSPMLHSAAKAGILSAGKDVVDVGLCSSPVAEYALENTKGAAGLIIVTASHNPPEWNALKFVDGRGAAVSRERGAEIEKMALSKNYHRAEWNRTGSCETAPNASATHASAVLKCVDDCKIRSKKLRVALDFGNGTSSLSRELFEKLGMEVTALNGNIDGNFPGRLSEPSEQNVQGLLKEMKKGSYDFGVAWDGDSDRVVFVDEKGRWIVGDKGFAISAKKACEEAGMKEGGTQAGGKKVKYVVTTVATSRCVEEACAQHGVKTLYTAVGAPYLSEKMIELSSSAISGGEEVGGIIWPSFSLAKDGLYAAAKIAEMCCEHKLSELVSGLPVYYNAKSKPDAAPGKKAAGLAAAKKRAEASKGKLTLVDGVRVDFEDGWVIVRASGTENAMRIFAEGKTEKRATSLMKEYSDTVKEAMEK